MESYRKKDKLEQVTSTHHPHMNRLRKKPEMDLVPKGDTKSWGTESI